MIAIFDALTTLAAEGEDEIEARSTGKIQGYYCALLGMAQCSVWISGHCV